MMQKGSDRREGTQKSGEAGLTRLFVKLLVFVGNFRADCGGVLPKFIVEPAPHFELDAFTVADSQGTDPPCAPARSSYVADNLSFIVVKSLHFLQVLGSFVLIEGVRLSEHNPFPSCLVDLLQLGEEVREAETRSVSVALYERIVYLIQLLLQ